MRPIIILFLLIVLATSAHADLVVNKYTNDFALTSSFAESLKACSCETRTDEFTVENNGNFPSQYKVIVHSNTNWFRPSITQFSLAQGEEFTFLVYAEPGCTEPADEEYIVQVISSYGREQSIKKSFSVKQCQNLFLDIDSGEPTNIADPIPFTMTLKNVAGFTDTFTLDFDQDVYPEQREFTLLPDEVKIIDATIIPPKDFTGTLMLSATITSGKNNLEETKQHAFSIENWYDHAILLGSGIKACSRVTTPYTVQLQNLYNASNTYTIEVTGGFAESYKEMVSLGGLESENITLAISPERGDEGRHTATITATSDFGAMSKVRTLDIDVVDCFDFAVTQPEPDVACCGEKTYALTIHNSGTQEETYNIVIDGPAWFTSDIKTVRLQPNEKADVQFDAQLPCTDDTYRIPVHIVLNSHPDLVETATFVIESQHPLTCHEVTAKLSTVRMDERDTVIPVIIESTGIAGGTYSLSIDSRLHVSVEEDSLTLAPGERKVIHLNTIYNITDYFDGKYLSHLTITQDSLEYNTPFWTKFDHAGWLSKAWDKALHYNYAGVPFCLWLLLLLALIALFMLIWLLCTLAGIRFSFQRGMTEESLFTFRLITAALLLVSMIALFLIPLPDKSSMHIPAIDDSSGLVLQWYENEPFTVDLDKYFNDPDGDTLSYTATQTEHIRVVIEGSTATLQPEINWAGQENIVFTATDNGIYVDSPILLLNVLKRADLTFSQWLLRYCTQLSLGLIIIALLTMLLIALLGITPVVFYPMPVPTKPREPKMLYVAAANGSKVHQPDCLVAQRIPKGKKVTFTTKLAASREGYAPCKVCKPFK